MIAYTRRAQRHVAALPLHDRTLGCEEAVANLAAELFEAANIPGRV